MKVAGSTKEHIRSFLRRSFDIRVGEYQRAILMQLNIFLIVLTLLIIKPVMNALFLAKLGAKQLPLVFILVAVAAFVVSTFYARLLNRYSLNKIIIRTHLLTALGLVVLGVLLRLNIFEQGIVYVFYVGVAIWGLVATSQFWILANLVFNPREAKRLFSFIGSGAIAGGIAGGYVTSVLARFIASENLLFLAAAILLCCIWINQRLWVRYVQPINKIERQNRKPVVSEHPVKLIRRSRHLTYLALIVGISVIVAKLVDFQFSTIAADNYQDPDQLAAFLGFWFSNFNLVSLGLQLFLTRRVVGKYGVGFALTVLPAAIFAGTIALLIAPVLWAGVLVRLFDISLKQSINKSATELLALPIPKSMKGQVKSFIDVFMDTAATGISGLMLIFLINGLQLSIRSVGMLILCLLIAWGWIAWRMRNAYLEALANSLINKGNKAKDAFDLSKSSVVEGLRKALLQGTEHQRLYILRKLTDMQETRLIPASLGLLEHPEADIRVAALNYIYYSTNDKLIETVRPLLQDVVPEVRYHAFRCVLRFSKDDRVAVIHEHLHHADPFINGAALVGLAMEARDNPEMRELFKLKQLIQEKLAYLKVIDDPETLHTYKVMTVRAIGHGHIVSLYPQLLSFLEDEDQEVVHQTLFSIGHTLDPEHIPLLAEWMIHKQYRDTATKALAAYGRAILPYLKKMYAAESVAADAARLLPRVVEHIGTQSGLEFLYGLVDHTDREVKLQALRSLNAIRFNHPNLSIDEPWIFEVITQESSLHRDTLQVLYTQHAEVAPDQPELTAARQELIQLLEHRLDDILNRIFQLLGLKYPPEIVQLADSIKAPDKETRMNAMEYLEILLEPNLKKLIIPIVESFMVESLSDDVINRLNLKIPKEYQCFELILQGNDARLKKAVIKLIGLLRTPTYKKLLQPLLTDPDPKIAKAASDTLQHLN